MPCKYPMKKESDKNYREKNKEKIKERTKEYYEKNKETIKEKTKEYYIKNKEDYEEYQREYRKKNKEKTKEQYKEYYDKNKEQISERNKEYRDAITRNAIDSITSGHIIDRSKWDMWCGKKKGSAKNKHPYSDDFTNDIMFDMMTKGCYYCGDVATTIDRLNSTLGHTPENCVGCCGPCNNSKGIADPATFIRKSYFKARRKYVDNVIDVWFVNKKKPEWKIYKRNAIKKEVPFELDEEKWNSLITDECAYCHRMPTTWFGVDRVVPSTGYVIDNVVTCCYDCNLDKHTHDVETTMTRNERIASRIDIGDLIIEVCEKVILSQKQK